MIIGTSKTSRDIDKYCIETLKIPGIVLMENAAIKLLHNINFNKNNYFTIVCGKGNNGGDGFALGRHLIALGKEVDFFLIGREEGMSKDCFINYNILKNMNLQINIINSIEDINELRESLQKSDVTIDAIFGTGLTREVEGIYESVISVINENSSYVLAVDIPSGLDGNTGNVLGTCIRADKTVSFVIYKKGFINYNAQNFTGNIVVENIGIPKHVIEKFYENEFILDKITIKKYFKKRRKYDHKGDYGRTLVIAGSKGYTGAAYIATQAAVRSGAGLVTLCTDRDIQHVLSSKLVEAMTVSIDDKDKFNQIFKKSNSMAIGPGMGNNEKTLKILKEVLKNSNCPIIIDADGINVLKDRVELLKDKKSLVILTPHLGEMARLTNLSIDYIRENRIEVAKDFAKKYEVIVLLKGYNTVITDGNKTIINPTGNSSMASGGMGDCLTGIIASLVAQGYLPMTATAIAAFVHGYCGEKLSKDMFCVNASHVLEYLPKGIKDVVS